MSYFIVIAVGMLTVGYVAGGLLPGWQAIGYIALLGLIPPVLMALTSLLYDPLLDAAVTMLVWAVLPTMVGAVIGTFVSAARGSLKSAG